MGHFHAADWAVMALISLGPEGALLEACARYYSELPKRAHQGSRLCG